MKVLVVGATGMVGSEVVKFAVHNNHDVTALVRQTSNRAKLEWAGDKVRFAVGDVLDNGSLERAMKAQDAVLIALRYNTQEKNPSHSFTDVELGGVLNIVNWAKKFGLQKIANISADGVHSYCKSDMFKAKYNAEEALVNSGIDYTVFKPSGLFFDFKDFHIPKLLSLGREDTWPLGRLDIRMNPLSHVDLARCMVDALTNKKASNMRIMMGGKETITQGDLLNMIAKEAGIDTIYRKGTSKEELINRARENPAKSFFKPDEIDDFLNDNVIDHQPIVDIFGFEFQTIADYLKTAILEVKETLG